MTRRTLDEEGEPVDLIDPDRLHEEIDAPVEHRKSMGSTNDLLRRLARDGAPEGTTVVADELTAARGRNGRPWSSPPGGVWTSVLVRPSFGADHVGRLTFAGGVAVAETVAAALDDDAARLKWPNDVTVNGEKIAGVLTEAVFDGVPVSGKPVDEVFADAPPPEFVVLGIGINADLDPETLDVDRPVTTLRAATGGPVDPTAVAATLHERLLARCQQVETATGFRAVLDAWRRRSATLGTSVCVERRGASDVDGVAVAVNDRGALMVEVEGDQIEVTASECQRLRRRNADESDARVDGGATNDRGA